jgi:hypothetical protein
MPLVDFWKSSPVCGVSAMARRSTVRQQEKGVINIGGDEAYQRYSQRVLRQSMAEKEREAAYSNYIDHIDQLKA